MNKALLSSNKMNWRTPSSVYQPLDTEFHFTLDPAADADNAKCEKYYTEETDGLKQSWEGETVFLNPPYGREIGRWVAKAWEESRKPGTTVVMLIPARTDTAYFHEYVLGKGEIRFLRGRIKFLNARGLEEANCAPFPSMVVVYRAEEVE